MTDLIGRFQSRVKIYAIFFSDRVLAKADITLKLLSIFIKLFSNSSLSSCSLLRNVTLFWWFQIMADHVKVRSTLNVWQEAFPKLMNFQLCTDVLIKIFPIFAELFIVLLIFNCVQIPTCQKYQRTQPFVWLVLHHRLQEHSLLLSILRCLCLYYLG